MEILNNLARRERMFLYLSLFFILFNTFPLFGDLTHIQVQYVCIFTVLSLFVLYPNAILSKSILWFMLFVFILCFNAILGRHTHINGLNNYALPTYWCILIEIAWILPSLLIISILLKLDNHNLYKCVGYGSVIIIVISFIFILPAIISYSNILRDALHSENLEFERPLGLPDYTLMHAYTFVLPGLCFYAKINQGKTRIFIMAIIVLFYYVITQTAVSTSITVATLVIVFALLYDEKNKNATIVRFIVAGTLGAIIYYSGAVLSIIDWLMPFFEGTAVQYKLDDLYISIVEGSLQGDSFDGREMLHQISIDSFISNPIWGGGQAGGHSQVFDLLGTVGIIGFIPFSLMIWSCFKTYLAMIPRGLTRVFMIITFAIPCLFLYHKGIFGATGWLFTFVIAPSFIKAISDDSNERL